MLKFRKKVIDLLEARVSRGTFFKITAAGAASFLDFTFLPAPPALAAPERISLLPTVANDRSHRGLHWSAYFGSSYGGDDDPEMPYKALEQVIRPMNYSSIKGIFSPDPVNRKVSLRFGRIMRTNGVMPIMRDYRHYSATEPISDEHLDGILEGIHEGIPYWQLMAQPNNRVEWPGGNIPLPPQAAQAVDTVMRVWLPPAQKIIEGGGYPLLPDPCPGGDINDRVWMEHTLRWLQSNGLLDILDPLKHNGHSAPIGIQLYSGRTDEQRNPDGSIKFGTDEDGIKADGFNKHRVYQTIARKFVGFDVPIMATEGGVDVTLLSNPDDNSSPRIPNPNFRDLYLQIAQIQGSKERPPYLLNTADFLAVANLDPRQTWHEYALFLQNLQPSTQGVKEVQEQLRAFF